MRKLGLIAATTVASFSVVGIAAAVDVDSKLTVKTVGGKGTKAKPANQSLDVTITTSEKDPTKNGTFGSKSVVVHFDKTLKFNPSKFPTCSLTTVATRPEDCPAGSKVGTGKANAVAGPGGGVKVNPDVEAYNDKGGKLHLKLVAQPGEFDSKGILTGTLKSDTGKYGKKLVVPIPAKLQNNLGLFVTITSFNTKISAKKYKGFSYAEATGCVGGKRSFGADSIYTDNTGSKVVTTAKC